jgi:hypothetical protein
LTCYFSLVQEVLSINFELQARKLCFCSVKSYECILLTNQGTELHAVNFHYPFGYIIHVAHLVHTNYADFLPFSFADAKMKTKLRCVVIGFIIACGCYLSYWVATMSVHSSLEQDEDQSTRKQQQMQHYEDYEQNIVEHGKGKAPERNDDWQFANRQQNIVRKNKSNKALFGGETEENFVGGRSEAEYDIPEENSLKVHRVEPDDDDDETIELDEKPKQTRKSSSVVGAPNIKNSLVKKKHIYFQKDVDEQKGELQESLTRNGPAHHMQKSELDFEEENEYVSLDELKVSENEESDFEQPDAKHGSSSGKKKLDIESSPERPKTADDLEEVEVDATELDTKWSSLRAAGTNNHAVYPASHVRSHNIAPIPRIVQPSSARLSSGMFATKQPQIAFEDFDIESPSSLSSQSESGDIYYLIHGGQASKVNQAVRLHPLPDYIPTEYYIFSSNRCIFCIMSVNNMAEYLYAALKL